MSETKHPVGAVDVLGLLKEVAAWRGYDLSVKHDEDADTALVSVEVDGRLFGLRINIFDSAAVLVFLNAIEQWRADHKRDER